MLQALQQNTKAPRFSHAHYMLELLEYYTPLTLRGRGKEGGTHREGEGKMGRNKREKYSSEPLAVMSAAVNCLAMNGHYQQRPFVT